VDINPGDQGSRKFACQSGNPPSLPLFNRGNLLFTSPDKKEEAGLYFKDMMNPQAGSYRKNFMGPAWATPSTWQLIGRCIAELTLRLSHPVCSRQFERRPRVSRI
jgi:hypothetical protein